MRKYLYRSVQLTISALLLAYAPLVQAVPLPTPGAEASASALTPGDDAGTVNDSGPSNASATNNASGSGIAEAFASATVGGAARSRSLVESASGSAEDSSAGATARWVAQVETGGIDPGSPIDIDLDLNVDGFLDYLNNNTNVGAGDLLSSVTLRLTLFDTLTPPTNVFNGGASLSGVSRTEAPILIRSGDWADSSRDGDFTVDPNCRAFRCQVDVAASIIVDDALLVGFGDTFGVEVELITSAFQAQGRETGAGSDFSNTASVNLSSGTPGITFTLVPEPSTALLLGLGLTALAGPRRRRP